MPPILALDTAHYRATGVYTLYNRTLGLSFTFADLSTLDAFLEFYYRNPIAACFAYHALQERKRRCL